VELNPARTIRAKGTAARHRLCIMNVASDGL
jgi:hypothetical protein